jgi:hypothetical protein
VTIPAQFEEQIHKGDIGTEVTFQIRDGKAPKDISSADVITIYLQKPNGTVINKTGSASGTTAVYFTSSSGDFDQAGLYRIQVYIHYPTGESWKTNIIERRVWDNLA